MSDLRLDACEAALDDLTSKLDAHERSRRDAMSDADKREYFQDLIKDLKKEIDKKKREISSPGFGTEESNRRWIETAREIIKTNENKIRDFEGKLATLRSDAETRTDPPVSEEQRRAMHAAASGNSNLGIPKKVGEEFSEADPGGKLPDRK